MFYNIVYTINEKDYTKEQLNVWASGQIDLEKWNQSLQEYYSVVAVDDDIIVGFGDIDKTGYLDRLFVHADCQGKGIATAICNELEQAVEADIITTFVRRQTGMTLRMVMRNNMRKCIRCDIEMNENYDVKVEGAAYGLKVTKPGIFKDNLGKIHCAVCPKCGYVELYLDDTSKISE